MYSAIIKNIDRNTYLVDDTDGVIVTTEKEENATVFADEADAESTLEFLNDMHPDCWHLIAGVEDNDPDLPEDTCPVCNHFGRMNETGQTDEQDIYECPECWSEYKMKTREVTVNYPEIEERNTQQG